MGPIWFQVRSTSDRSLSTSPACFVKLLPVCLKHGNVFCIWRDKHQRGSCEAEKRLAKWNTQDTTESCPHEKPFTSPVLGHQKQCKENWYNTASLAHHLCEIPGCHLHDADVSLQDFFLRIFLWGDKLWGYCYTLTLIIDQHVLLIAGTHWITCKHRIGNPRINSKILESCSRG